MWSAWHAYCRPGNRYELKQASDHGLLLEHAEVLTLIGTIVNTKKLPKAARKAKAPATASKSKVDRVLTAWAAKPKGKGKKARSPGRIDAGARQARHHERPDRGHETAHEPAATARHLTPAGQRAWATIVRARGAACRALRRQNSLSPFIDADVCSVLRRQKAVVPGPAERVHRHRAPAKADLAPLVRTRKPVTHRSGRRCRSRSRALAAAYRPHAAKLAQDPAAIKRLSASADFLVIGAYPAKL